MELKLKEEAEKAAAEAEKRALEKEWALGRLKKREQVILDAIENIENGRISDKENGLKD